jgi:hypothetical protein
MSSVLSVVKVVQLAMQLLATVCKGVMWEFDVVKMIFVTVKQNSDGF